MENSIPVFKTCSKCGSTIMKIGGVPRLRFIDVGKKVYQSWCHNCCFHHYLHELSEEERCQLYAYESGEPTHLRCSKCEKVKSVTLFNRNSCIKRGYTSWCKECNIDADYDRRSSRRKERIKKYNEPLSQEEIDLMKTHKKCAMCKQWVSRDNYNLNKRLRDGLVSYCKPCRSEYHKVNVKPEERRKNRLKYDYGMTQEQYEALLYAQGGVCAICKQPETHAQRKGIFALSVDHHHETGAIRGLLCSRCNTAYGLLEESESRILALLEYHRRFNQD